MSLMYRRMLQICRYQLTQMDCLRQKGFFIRSNCQLLQFTATAWPDSPAFILSFAEEIYFICKRTQGGTRQLQLNASFIRSNSEKNAELQSQLPMFTRRLHLHTPLPNAKEQLFGPSLEQAPHHQRLLANLQDDDISDKHNMLDDS